MNKILPTILGSLATGVIGGLAERAISKSGTGPYLAKRGHGCVEISLVEGGGLYLSPLFIRKMIMMDYSLIRRLKPTKDPDLSWEEIVHLKIFRFWGGYCNHLTKYACEKFVVNKNSEYSVKLCFFFLPHFE